MSKPSRRGSSTRFARQPQQQDPRSSSAAAIASLRAAFTRLPVLAKAGAHGFGERQRVERLGDHPRRAQRQEMRDLALLRRAVMNTTGIAAVRLSLRRPANFGAVHPRHDHVRQNDVRLPVEASRNAALPSSKLFTFILSSSASAASTTSRISARPRHAARDNAFHPPCTCRRRCRRRVHFSSAQSPMRP